MGGKVKISLTLAKTFNIESKIVLSFNAVGQLSESMQQLSILVQAVVAAIAEIQIGFFDALWHAVALQPV